jgi:hypothetical protein
VEPDHPPHPDQLHVTVAVTVTRRPGWRTAGIAVSLLQLPEIVIHLIRLVLRATGHQ